MDCVLLSVFLLETWDIKDRNLFLAATVYFLHKTSPHSPTGASY